MNIDIKMMMVFVGGDRRDSEAIFWGGRPGGGRQAYFLYPVFHTIYKKLTIAIFFLHLS